jgi:hypothetical protein
MHRIQLMQVEQTARKQEKASVHKKLSIYSNKAIVWVLELHYDVISLMLHGFRLSAAQINIL